MGAGRRIPIILAVLALHVLIVLLFSFQRQRIEAGAPQTEIQVLIGAEAVDTAPVPQVQAQLLPPPTPILVLPNIEVQPDAVEEQAQVTQSSAAPTSQSSPGDMPLQVQRIDYIRRPFAEYPPKAKRRGVTGMVLLLVRVGADGLAKDAQIYRTSGNPDLDAAAKQAVFNAVFRPESENGVAREIRVIVPIEFTLTVQPNR